MSPCHIVVKLHLWATSGVFCRKIGSNYRKIENKLQHGWIAGVFIPAFRLAGTAQRLE
jgi:hypothetical protein